MLAPASNDPRLSELIAALRPVNTNRPLVRVGSEHDGGYLVPDDLDGLVACFSPGVSKIADFELALANRGVPCFLADASVEAPPVSHPLFRFEKKFLGPETEGDFISLENWMDRNAPTKGDMVLQMDIEGAEFDVLAAASRASLRRFRIIVIEFHSVGRLFLKKEFDRVSSPFRQLLVDFDVVHIHPNNCCGEVARDGVNIPRIMEFTFLRKDRITQRTPASVFPHPLDTPNVPHKPDQVLPGCWFGDAIPDSPSA
jgi:hypothetical protein